MAKKKVPFGAALTKNNQSKINPTDDKYIDFFCSSDRAPKGKDKIQFTVDGLKLCYKAEAATIDYLRSVTYDCESFQDVELARVPTTTLAHENVVGVIMKHGKMHFGNLYFSDGRCDKDGKTYVWFTVENKVFYTSFSRGVNIIMFASMIADDLGLIPNNITSLDIACDTTVNLSPRIKRAVFAKELIPVVNNRAYDDERDTIRGLRFSYGCNQKQMKDLSIVVKQTIQSGGMELSTYNKSKEILESSGKEYIGEWLQMKKAYRMEVRLDNAHVREFCENSDLWHEWYINSDSISINQLLIAISDSESPLLAVMFFHFADRLIHFRDKKTRKIISIFDL